MMQITREIRPVLLIAILVVAVGTSVGKSPASETTQVADTYNKLSFSYRVNLDREFDSFRVYRLAYPSPVQTSLKQNNLITAELYLPKDISKVSKPRPAVICLHILGGGFELTQLQCSALARRGVPAIWFKLPYYGERGPPEGTRALAASPRLFTEAVHQGIQDVRRTVDVLASRPDVDRQHIGIMGVSLGGILAATAAEQEPRLARAVLILSGGDLLPIVHRTRETQRLSETIHRLSPAERTEVERAITSADPLQNAAALRDRAKHGRVLMINAGEDEVIPRASTEKLASALAIKDRIIWLDGLGHYTALAALPRALKSAVDFFAQDLPADAAVLPTVKKALPRQEFVRVLQQCWQIVGAEPKQGHCHCADLDLHVTLKDGKKYDGRIRIVRGPKAAFDADLNLPGLVDDVSLGNSKSPWLSCKEKLFLGVRKSHDPPVDMSKSLSPEVQKGMAIAEGLVNGLVMAPEILEQWLSIDELPSKIAGERIIRVLRRGVQHDGVLLFLQADGSPVRLEADLQGASGGVTFRSWQIDREVGKPLGPALCDPPLGPSVEEVPAADLTRMFSAVLNFAVERVRPFPAQAASKSEKIIARDPAGHGLLCEFHGKRLLFVEGTPEQMGTAQGLLLRSSIAKLTERVVYGVGAADTVASGTWWFDRTAEIQRRAGPHVPARFIAECDAMAKAASLSVRDARAANLFPERFHCSGVAVRGKATRDGRVLHARVLDYMRDIGLQNHACVTVFIPKGHHAWISAGYAGFLGTVTAMNERGLAIGEMGGRGEGQWDGVPMSFLLRDIMERAATVNEALAILRTSPRTCEYYYVLSDKSRQMVGVYCTPKEVTVLQPGQQHPRLPHIPEETVLISGDRRAQVLSERIQKSYGQIDVPKLMEIIKRPVAMNSNLHDAIFSPETLEIWIADAGGTTPACDEPYAEFNLKDLLAYFHRQGNR
jgi:isopenicillin-N N-acyltransferase like protein